MSEALGRSYSDFPLLPGMEEGRLRPEIILGAGCVGGTLGSLGSFFFKMSFARTSSFFP